MATAGSIRAGAAFVEFFADKSPLIREMREMEAGLKNWGGRLTRTGGTIMAAGLAVASPIVLAVKAFSDGGSELVDLSAKTGMSTDALQTLGYAADQSGASIETLAGGVRKMQDNIFGANDGSKEAQSALEGLGLTAASLFRMQPDEQFRTIADSISKIENPAARTAAALDIFGKSGTELLAMMVGGREGLEDLESEVRGLNSIMSGKALTSADKFGDTLHSLWVAGKGVANNIAADLFPEIQTLTSSMVGATAEVSKWVRENRDFVQQMVAVTAGVIGFGGAIVATGLSLSLMGTAVGGLSSAAAGMAGILGSSFAFLMTPVGMLVATIGLGAAAFVAFTETGRSAAGLMGEWFSEVKRTGLNAWQGIVDAVMSGDLALAGQIAGKGLELAMMQTQKPIMSYWDEVVNNFIYGWEAAGETLMHFANHLEGAMVHAANAMKIGFAQVLTWFQGAMLDALKLIDDGFRAIGSRVMPHDQQYANRIRVLNSNKNQIEVWRRDDATINDKLRRRDEMIDQAFGKRFADRKNAISEKWDAGAGEVDQIKRQMQELNEKADEQRRERERLNVPDKLRLPDMPSFEYGRMSQTSVSTLSGAAAARLGGDTSGPMAATAKNTEAIAGHTRRTADATDDLVASLRAR